MTMASLTSQFTNKQFRGEGDWRRVKCHDKTDKLLLYNHVLILNQCCPLLRIICIFSIATLFTYVCISSMSKAYYHIHLSWLPIALKQHVIFYFNNLCSLSLLSIFFYLQINLSFDARINSGKWVCYCNAAKVYCHVWFNRLLSCSYDVRDAC